MKKIFLIAAMCFCIHLLQGQELNAKLTLNTSKIAGSEKSVFTTLQNSLEQLLNGTKWTETNFASNEKIECSFTLILNSISDNTFSGELQVTSSRPVYNASYTTPMFNFRDVNITFNYTEGETLQYSPNDISSNLIATMAYYAYIVIGLDFDSFAMNGGAPYFQTAMQIVNAAQALNVKGWAAFDNNKNRYALALALTEESMKPFHEMWYQYHRLGMDDLAANVNRGRTQISSSLDALSKIKNIRTANVAIAFFGDTKLEEIGQVFGQASSDQKQSLYKLLNEIYPTKTSVLNKLK
ncbi:MAG: DUF4835 family protein [Dysgonamonadaceae bacterium]